MFLDLSGARARRLRRVGAVLAALLAAWPVGLLAGASGFDSLPPVSTQLTALPAAPGATPPVLRVAATRHDGLPRLARHEVAGGIPETRAARDPHAI